MRSTPRFVARLLVAAVSYAAVSVVAVSASLSTTSAGQAPAPVPAPAPSPATASSIGPLAKEHNLDLGDRSMGMRITVPTELVGVAGQTVAVVLWFYDAGGQPIRSALDGWGDVTNHLRIVSRDVSPTASPEHADFAFRVPYCAFPSRREGRYAVEARAVLVERVGNGRAVLARRSTTFFVE